MDLAQTQTRLTNIAIDEQTGLCQIKLSNGETSKATLQDVVPWLSKWLGQPQPTHDSKLVLSTGNCAMWAAQCHATLTRFDSYSAFSKFFGGKWEVPPLWLYLRYDIKGKHEASGLWVEVASTTTWQKARVRPWLWGNVHSTGLICWGTVVLDGEITPDALIELFFLSQFNLDLRQAARPGSADEMRNQLAVHPSQLLETYINNVHPLRF